MANSSPKRPNTPGSDPSMNQTDRKVVKSTDRVENVKKTNAPHDMGDVMARDSIAEDGVKQTP